MKPPERAPGSNGAKHGSVLPDAMRGTRLPSSSCVQPQELPLNQALSHQHSYPAGQPLKHSPFHRIITDKYALEKTHQAMRSMLRVMRLACNRDCMLA